MNLKKQLKSGVIIRSAYDSLVRLKNMSGKQRQRFGAGITRDFKDIVFIYAIYAICIICAIMLLLYRKEFGMSLSPDSEDWGNFGAYLGSITGLLAFLGVLYTIRQSKEQAESSEERGVFFTMLGLYQKQVDSMTNGEVKGINAFTNYIDEINKITTMYIIYYEIISNYDYMFSTNEGSKEMMIQNELINTFHLDDDSTGILHLKEKIKSFLGIDKLIIPDNFNKYRILYELYATEILEENIKETLDKEDVKKYIFILINKSSKILHIKYGQYLGQYFRNIYYLLETISTTKESKNYSKIFRAQLSSYELILLLYNALGSKSSIETVDYYSEHKLFNNIDIDSNIILKSFYLRFNTEAMINELFEIYKANKSK